MKFENGLRSEIKRAIGYQQIRKFHALVNGCRIYEEDTKSHYKMVNDKRGKQQNRGKPYSVPAGKGKLKAKEGKKPSGGEASTGVTCFNCREIGHYAKYFPAREQKKCYKCGKAGHEAPECRLEGVTCFNCGEKGHVRTQCQKPRKEQSGGKVFALAGVQTTSEDNLIRGTCFINSTPLIAIIDTGATHSFISAECVSKLNLSVSNLKGRMVIETPAKGSVSTFLVCLKCPLSIFDKDFVVDLVCLPLSGLDVILGMDWLESNRAHINCCEKYVRFLDPGEEGEEGFLSARQLNELVRNEARVFALFASLSVKSQL